MTLASFDDLNGLLLYWLMIERTRHCRQDVTFSFEDVIQLLTRGRKVLLAGPFLVPLERGKCNELAHAKMAAIIGKGDRVYVFATYFDTPNSGNAWSRSLFCSSYDTTKCNGTVIKVTCSCATVLWDIDKNTTRCLLKDLFSSDGRAVIAAGVTPAASAAKAYPASSYHLQRYQIREQIFTFYRH
ncbi:hypothetical protein J6590_030257 [Homalodisca vitripennis]|nr:hypothetical protein J6590_030257 [Homalodisca vitripennis]